MNIDLMPLAYVAFWFCVAFGVHSCSEISVAELKYKHLEESCNEPRQPLIKQILEDK